MNQRSDPPPDTSFDPSRIASDPGEHAIKAVTTRCVAMPFGTVLRTSTSGFDAAYLLLVDVTTASGVRGIGWTFAFSRSHLLALEHLAAHLAPAVTGRSAIDVAARWSDMRRALERPGVVGSGSMAMAAIDIALWDVLGKVACLPVATLLGGHRRRVDSFHSFGLWSDQSIDELEADARRLVAKGATAMKLRAGGRPLADEVERAAAVRDAVPPGTALIVDANSAWTPKQAVAMCTALADVGITWIEDPTPAREAGTLEDVRRSIPFPVCGGEDVYLADGLDIATAFPFDVAMVDVFRVGGISGFVRVAHALALRGLPVTPHLDTATGVHLVAGIENAVWVEYLPWWGSLFRSFPGIAEGSITVPDTPGLGLDWDGDLDHFEVPRS